MPPSVYIRFNTEDQKRVPAVLKQHYIILFLKIHPEDTVSTSMLLPLLSVLVMIFRQGLVFLS